MGKIRVLLTDDSAVARDLLRSFLENDGEIEIVGEATNGEEAVRLALELKPDLVTMDLEMPVMGGMDAIIEIMATQAVPILVVSSVADAKKAYAAVAHGALDAINKPGLDLAAGAEFVAKVKMLAKIRVIAHIRSRASTQTTPDIIQAMPVLPASFPDSAAMSRLTVAGATPSLMRLLRSLSTSLASISEMRFFSSLSHTALTRATDFSPFLSFARACSL